MFNHNIVSSGGAISMPLIGESAPVESFNVASKATLALVCSISMFMPSLSSAAVTKRAQEASYYDVASISEVEGGTQLLFVSEPQVLVETTEAASGLDLLFPNARSSNEYEQEVIATLMDRYFE
ncbi:MAG: hypothetical protein Q9M16_06915 [Mariprofundus sp.]|nr:hypothetical protein [Mariprofundus sp.]